MRRRRMILPTEPLFPRPTEVEIEVRAGDYRVHTDEAGRGGLRTGQLHAKTLLGPHYHQAQPGGRQALLLHAGVPGSNHSLLERPARFLLARDLLDLVILPDLRGSGDSSGLPRGFMMADHVADLHALLDRMNIQGPLLVVGVSYSGPLALALAAADPRVQCVALVASGPSLRPPGGLVGALLQKGWLMGWVDYQLRRKLGKRPPKTHNFDPGYDAPSPAEMSKRFSEALMSIPPERAEALRAEYEITLNPARTALPEGFALDIPVLQVIGEGDEVWDQETAEALQARFPRFARRVVAGAAIHKDLFLRAPDFWAALADLLEEACPLVRKP